MIFPLYLSLSFGQRSSLLWTHMLRPYIFPLILQTIIIAQMMSTAFSHWTMSQLTHQCHRRVETETVFTNLVKPEYSRTLSQTAMGSMMSPDARQLLPQSHHRVIYAVRAITQSVVWGINNIIIVNKRPSVNNYGASQTRCQPSNGCV